MPSEYKWLPHTGIWARLPLAAVLAGSPKRGTTRPARCPAPCSAPQASLVSASTLEKSPSDLKATAAAACHDSEDSEDDSAQLCSICEQPDLAHSLALEQGLCFNAYVWLQYISLIRDITQRLTLCIHAGLSGIEYKTMKAILQPCMHVFCLHCLDRWISIKRSCPLCKVFEPQGHGALNLTHCHSHFNVLAICPSFRQSWQDLPDSACNLPLDHRYDVFWSFVQLYVKPLTPLCSS